MKKYIYIIGSQLLDQNVELDRIQHIIHQKQQSICFLPETPRKPNRKNQSTTGDIHQNKLISIRLLVIRDTCSIDNINAKRTTNFSHGITHTDPTDSSYFRYLLGRWALLDTSCVKRNKVAWSTARQLQNAKKPSMPAYPPPIPQAKFLPFEISVWDS